MGIVHPNVMCLVLISLFITAGVYATKIYIALV